MNITKETNIYITGGGGMLGEAVHEVFSAIANVKCTDIDVNSDFLTYADVRDSKAIREDILSFKPHLIIHLAALTDLEYCELHAEEAWETNAFATENVALIARELDIPMVYISTAGIFDGRQEFYTDYDAPNPINVYGKSKYAGELLVQHYPKHFVFRAGWMTGGRQAKDKKFVGKIMKQIREGAKELFVVDDKLGTPTYTYDFAKNMLNVLQNGPYGIYNMVCDGSCSRYDVAEEILVLLKRQDITLHKVDSDYLKDEYFAPRPLSEKLIPFKLKKHNLYLMREWQTCLEEYLLQRWQ
jgi:dTDP-4-dehydrorhamnose reductase